MTRCAVRSCRTSIDPDDRDGLTCEHGATTCDAHYADDGCDECQAALSDALDEMEQSWT